MKYLVEVETVIDGEIFAAGSIIENPSEVKAGLVLIKEEVKAKPAKPKAKKAKKAEVEVQEVEVQEEILIEDSADVEVISE
jgi:hypothetical protein